MAFAHLRFQDKRLKCESAFGDVGLTNIQPGNDFDKLRTVTPDPNRPGFEFFSFFHKHSQSICVILDRTLRKPYARLLFSSLYAHLHKQPRFEVSIRTIKDHASDAGSSLLAYVRRYKSYLALLRVVIPKVNPHALS